MDQLYKTDWLILKMLDENKELTINQIIKKINNNDSENQIRMRISNLMKLNLISYTGDSIVSHYAGKGDIEAFEITSEGHNIVTDHYSVKKENQWKELRVSIIWPVVASIISAIVFFLIGLYVGIKLK